MNDTLKPNEPFSAEEEQKSYYDYKKSEKYVEYNGEDVLVNYKTDINVDKKTIQKIKKS